MLKYWLVSIIIAGLIVWIAYHVYLAAVLVGEEYEE